MSLINFKISTFNKGSHFSHVFNKTCQYASNGINVCVGIWNVNLTTTQYALQKKIIHIKQFDKGCNEWQKACFNHGLSHFKLKTPTKTKFVNKVIMFQKTLEYRGAINLCYGKQENQELQGCVPNTHTWAVCKVVVETMHPIVK